MHILTRSILSAALAATVGTVAPSARAADEHHGHEAHHGTQDGPAKLALDHGRKWPTDAPLRTHMEALRTAFAAQLHAIHGNTMTPAEYAALGASVEQRVGRIVAECRLEPKADAMLHLVVADLIAGADAMQGKSETAPAAGAHEAAMALNAYGRHFRHPGWKPLK